MTRQQLIERWGKWSEQAIAEFDEWMRGQTVSVVDGEIFYYVSDVERFEEWYFQGLTL